MNRSALHHLSAEAGEPVTRFDRAVECVLAGLLLFMPAALGVVAPWSETIVACAAVTIAVCLAAKRLVHREISPIWSWAYLPVLLFIALAAVQLLPLPAGLVGAISPNTLAMRQQLLSDLPSAGDSAAVRLSFYAPATRHHLLVVIVAAVVFLAVIEVYRRPDQIKRLLAVVSVIGGAAALLALLQDLSRADKIFWVIPAALDTANAGPFVNHNNFSQFMSLSMGAALGLLLVQLRQIETRAQGHSSTTPWREAGAWRTVWVLGSVVVLGIVSVFLSLSRGGMVSVLAALSVTTLVVARRRGRGMRAQGWAITLLALVAFVALLYVGFDAVSARFGSLGRHEDRSAGRAQVYKDIAVIWRQFPVAGVGLGTHEFVFPKFDRSTNAYLAEFADSDWFQMAEEVGTAGLVLIVAFVAIVGASFVRAARADRPRVCVAAFGLGFGLLAVMINSFTDFGQHLPAVACLSAVSCGLLLNLARLARRAAAPARFPVEAVAAVPVATSRWGLVVRLAVPVMLVVAVAWAAVQAYDRLAAARHWDFATQWVAALETNGWQGDDDDYSALLSAAEAAVAIEPDDVRYRHALNWYRWRSISRETDPDTGLVSLAPDAVEHAKRIVRELHEARRLCATYGPLVSVAGQLERSLGLSGGAEHVRAGYALAPTHPITCFAAAAVDADEEKWDDSVQKSRRCLSLDPQMLSDVMGLYITAVGRPELAVLVARERADWLLMTVQALREAGVDREKPVSAALAEALALLKSKHAAAAAAGTDTPAWMLASMAILCRDQKDLKSSVEFYRQALKKEYGQVTWHYELALVLKDLGEHAEAIREANICLHLQPQMAAAKQLIGELGVRAQSNE